MSWLGFGASFRGAAPSSLLALPGEGGISSPEPLAQAGGWPSGSQMPGVQQVPLAGETGPWCHALIRPLVQEESLEPGEVALLAQWDPGAGARART